MGRGPWPLLLPPDGGLAALPGLWGCTGKEAERSGATGERIYSDSTLSYGLAAGTLQSLFICSCSPAPPFSEEARRAAIGAPTLFPLCTLLARHPHPQALPMDSGDETPPLPQLPLQVPLGLSLLTTWASPQVSPTGSGKAELCLQGWPHRPLSHPAAQLEHPRLSAPPTAPPHPWILPVHLWTPACPLPAAQRHFLSHPQYAISVSHQFPVPLGQPPHVFEVLALKSPPYSQLSVPTRHP